MRAWKVFTVQGKPIDLEIALNKIQKDGWVILPPMPGSFGYTIVAYMDEPSTYSAIGMDSPL